MELIVTAFRITAADASYSLQVISADEKGTSSPRFLKNITAIDVTWNYFRRYP